jgi:hypothetical protein
LRLIAFYCGKRCILLYYEHLFIPRVLSMKLTRAITHIRLFKSRRANAYLYASNLAHLPRQLAWGAKKRGQKARATWAAYSSQACSRCHFTSRDNRPRQQTFCCQVCGLQLNADVNAALNHQARFDDRQMQACGSKQAVKALLDARHVAFVQSQDRRSRSSRREPAFGCESISGQSGVGQHQPLAS